jgi:isoleucyl-tRNA synthetase
LYARAAGWTPSSDAVPAAERNVLDRWALSESARLARDVDDALEEFDTQRAGRLIAEHVDDLSNWYVRRSRRRFWRGDADALQTLHECLRTITQVLAPLTPFITERVWQDLFADLPGEPSSVHLSSWPVVTPDMVDESLAEQMALVRRVVELGRAARAESGVKTRQPLGRALVGAAGWSSLDPELREQVADELNVVDVQSLDSEDAALVDVSVKANFRSLGKRFGQQTPTVAAAIAAADAGALVFALRSGTASVVVDGEAVAVTDEDVLVTESPREGWSVASDEGVSCALDLSLTEDLVRAGVARDLVRVLQEARKSAGLEVTDRIDVVWSSDDADAQGCLVEYTTMIAGEVLAESFVEGDIEALGGFVAELDEPAVRFSLRKVRA